MTTWNHLSLDEATIKYGKIIWFWTIQNVHLFNGTTHGQLCWVCFLGRLGEVGHWCRRPERRQLRRNKRKQRKQRKRLTRTASLVPFCKPKWQWKIHHLYKCIPFCFFMEHKRLLLWYLFTGIPSKVPSLSKLRLLDFRPLYWTYVLGVNDMNVTLLVFLLVLVCGGKAKEQRFNLAISTLNRCLVCLNCNQPHLYFWKNLMWMQQLHWQSWGVADQV